MKQTTKNRFMGVALIVATLIAIIAICITCTQHSHAADFDSWDVTNEWFEPEPAEPDFPVWYVGKDWLTSYSENTYDSEVVTAFPHGTALYIIGCDGNGWWQVYNGYSQSWVRGCYMVENPDEWSFGSYLGVFYSTVYTPNPAENAGYSTTCYGEQLTDCVGEIVACSEYAIPHHRWIYIEGVGYRRTADRGVTGQHIDILQWGEYDIPTRNRRVWLVE